jgi:hypothetical protein
MKDQDDVLGYGANDLASCATKALNRGEKDAGPSEWRDNDRQSKT